MREFEKCVRDSIKEGLRKSVEELVRDAVNTEVFNSEQLRETTDAVLAHVTRMVESERWRCAKIACPGCAAGLPRVKNYEHQYGQETVRCYAREILEA